MALRSPITTKKRQIAEAIKILREEGMNTPMSTVEEIDTGDYETIPGQTNGGVKEEFHIIPLHADACKTIKGASIDDENCLVRTLIIPGRDNEVISKQPNLVD